MNVLHPCLGNLLPVFIVHVTTILQNMVHEMRIIVGNIHTALLLGTTILLTGNIILPITISIVSTGIHPNTTRKGVLHLLLVLRFVNCQEALAVANITDPTIMIIMRLQKDILVIRSTLLAILMSTILLLETTPLEDPLIILIIMIIMIINVRIHAVLTE